MDAGTELRLIVFVYLALDKDVFVKKCKAFRRGNEQHSSRFDLFLDLCLSREMEMCVSLLRLPVY